MLTIHYMTWLNGNQEAFEIVKAELLNHAMILWDEVIRIHELIPEGGQSFGDFDFYIRRMTQEELDAINAQGLYGKATHGLVRDDNCGEQSAFYVWLKGEDKMIQQFHIRRCNIKYNKKIDKSVIVKHLRYGDARDDGCIFSMHKTRSLDWQIQNMPRLDFDCSYVNHIALEDLENENV